jgi:succinate dehydrogenase / fumarate reductase cytochrome b subunit
MDHPRPKHLDLSKISLPLPAFVSILHRISGVLLFLALPPLLLALQYSLRSVETHTELMGILGHPFAKLAMLALVWLFLQHLCSGIRILMIDLNVGKRQVQTRTSSKWVLFFSLALTVLAGIRLW